MPTSKGGLNMWDVSPKLLRDAKIEAAKMAKSGEVIRAVPFGEVDDTIFVSSDQDLVRGTSTFELDGVTYFVGTKR